MTLMTEQDHSNVSSLRAFASRYCKLSTIVVTTRYYFDGRKTGKSITRTRYVTKAYRHLVFIYVPFLGNHARPSHCIRLHTRLAQAFLQRHGTACQRKSYKRPGQQHFGTSVLC